MNVTHNGVRYKLKGFSKSFLESLKSRDYTRGVTWWKVNTSRNNVFVVRVNDKGSEMVEGHLSDSVGANLGDLLSGIKTKK